MKSKPAASDADILERAKTATPYSAEERCTYDGEEDVARILATMEWYLKNRGE